MAANQPHCGAGMTQDLAMAEAVATALISARRRISDPEKWSEIWEAVDADGRAVSPVARSAVAWETSGALKYAIEAMRGLRLACIAELHAWEVHHACMMVLMGATRGLYHPTYVNLQHGHAAVLEMFDQAIANWLRDHPEAQVAAALATSTADEAGGGQP